MILLIWQKGKYVCFRYRTIFEEWKKSYETVSYTSKHSTLSENHSGQLKKFFTGTVFSCFCYLILFSVLHGLGYAILVHPVIGMVLAGFLVGTGYYFCISSESTAVGFDVIALILNKKNPKINIALTMYLINTCVLLFGLLSYGITSVLTGIGFTALQSLTLNCLLKRKE